MNTYDVGDQIRITATFTDIDGAAVDPATLQFKFKTPGSAITTYVYGVDAQIVKSGVGVYYVDVPIDASGTWSYRFAGTGAGQAAAEGQFDVRQSYF